MTIAAIIIPILTAIIVGMQFFKFWVFSNGNIWLTYRLNCFIFIGYLCMETILAFNAPGQLPLLAMNLVNLWALSMNAKGILRLKSLDKEKVLVPVIIESPYAASQSATVKDHEFYARRCMKNCLKQGEAPLASHLLYTQKEVLDDGISEERDLGITAGFSWRKSAHKTVVYTDYGTSNGMKHGIEHAKLNGHVIEYRAIGRNPS